MMLVLLLACTDGGTDLSPYVPKVTFNRFDLVDLDFEHIDVDFVFDVDNPNPVDIPLARFDYSLGFEGVELIAGDDPNGLELKSDATSEMALPVGLEFANIFDIAEAVRGVDTIGFGLAGSFGFDTDLGPVDIEYDESGDFPALRTPSFDLGQLRIESADADSVEFGLDVDVDNDHASVLDFSNLDFRVKFAGVRVGSGTEEEVGEVAGASTETKTIPFTVDYADAIAALSAAVSGDALNVKLDADMDVDTPFGIVPLTVDETGDVEVRDETP
jgi:LEA14-like dessication related protein